MLHLVTSAQPEDHITSANSAHYNAGTQGNSSYILPVREQMRPSIVGTNTVRIMGGDAQTCGRHWEVKGDFIDVQIDNGTPGLNRIDLIVAHIETAPTENIELRIIKGDEAAGEPAIPAYITGDLNDGDVVCEAPICAVRIEGITIAKVTPQMQVSVPASEKADKTHTHNVGDIIAGALPISRGGTEATTTAQARVNLLADTAESETKADDSSLFLMVAASRNGVVVRKGSYIWEWLKGKVSAGFGFSTNGILGIPYGGTGANARGDAMDNLTKLGTNVIANNAADTLANWRNAGFGVGWFSESKLEGQPYATGSILNIPQPGLAVVSQLWHSGSGGSWYHRGIDASGILPWHMFLDNSNTAARITRTGESNNWYYQVYSNKFCIATYLMSYSKTCVTPWGNGYYNTSKCGGADYPTALKWKAAPRVETVISSPDGRMFATHCNDGTATKAPTAYMCSFAEYKTAQSCRMVQVCMGWVE